MIEHKEHFGKAVWLALASILALGAIMVLALVVIRWQGLSGSVPASGAANDSATVSTVTTHRSPQESMEPVSDNRSSEYHATIHDGVEEPPVWNFDKALSEFESLRSCHAFFEAKQGAQRMPSTPLATNGVPNKELERMAQRMDHALGMLDENRQHCASLSRDQVRQRIFQVSLELGLRGYEPAQACFVQGLLSEANPFDGKAQAFRVYKRVAPDFIGDLLNAGNLATTWVVANKMSGKVWQQHGSTWINALPNADPYQAYRALRLVYYRVDLPEQLTLVEDFLASIASKYELTHKQLTDADAWAQRLYAEKFALQPPLSNPWAAEPCG